MWVWTWGNTCNPGWANARWDGTKLVQGNSGWVISARALNCERRLEGWLLLQARPGDALLEGPTDGVRALCALPWSRSCAFSPCQSKEYQSQSAKSNNTKVSPPRIPGMDRRGSQERGHGVFWKRRWYWREDWLRTSVKAPLWWPDTRDSKRDTDVKNRLSDSVGEGKGGMDDLRE